jgi:hypothetical protein
MEVFVAQYDWLITKSPYVLRPGTSITQAISESFDSFRFEGQTTATGRRLDIHLDAHFDGIAFDLFRGPIPFDPMSPELVFGTAVSTGPTSENFSPAYYARRGETGDPHSLDVPIYISDVTQTVGVQLGPDSSYQTPTMNGTYTMSSAEGRFYDTPTAGIHSFGADGSAGSWSNNDLTPRILADINGDHRADIVGFGSSGVYSSLSNAAGGFSSPTLVSTSFGYDLQAGGWTSNDHAPRLANDVNGDGRADLVGFGGAGVYVALAQGAGQFGSPQLVLTSFGSDSAAGGWSSEDHYPIRMGDVNGDGRADIVGFGSEGVYVAFGTPSGGFSSAQLLLRSFGTDVSAGGWSSDTVFHRELGDVNGDGRADIVGFGGAGTYIAFSTGNGFSDPILARQTFGADQSAGGWSDDNLFPRQVGDLNGDGRTDIIGFGADEVYVAFGTANGITNPAPALNSFGSALAAGGWSSNSAFPRVVADINGDHSADIVGFGGASVYTALGHDFFVI